MGLLRKSGEAKDRRLMKRAAEGDREASAQLFRLHGERLHRIGLSHFSRLPGQEAFTRGLDKFGRWRGDSEPDVWLYSIALNVCRQRLQKETLPEAFAAPADLEGARPPGRAPRVFVFHYVC